MGITQSVPIQAESRGRRLLPLLAVYFASEYYRLPWKPPVTAALIAANTFIYLDPAFLHHVLPSIYQVSFNPYLILKNMDMRRFFLSPFYHLGESHLFFNMLSLLWKGSQLETSMGSIEFASMVATLLTMSQGMTLLLAKALILFDYPKPFYTQYSVGFSGVLFAMKVVLNYDSADYTQVHGLMVPARYAAWAELLLIQLVAPDSSFLGHLGGILAGILYIKLQGRNTGLDPFVRIVRGLVHILKWPLRAARGLFQRSSRPRVIGQGSTVGGDRSRDGLRGVWRCVACTYDNSGWSSECEMCGTRRGGASSGDGGEVGVEEIRRRRIQRFGY
ncbi:Rhomboid-like protein 14, mitochondrial [Linum grandiflorum]